MFLQTQLTMPPPQKSIVTVPCYPGIRISLSLVILLSHIPISPKCPVGENNYSIASGWQISQFLFFKERTLSLPWYSSLQYELSQQWVVIKMKAFLCTGISSPHFLNYILWGFSLIKGLVLGFSSPRE